jgi:hypothetical protein
LFSCFWIEVWRTESGPEPSAGVVPVRMRAVVPAELLVASVSLVHIESPWYLLIVQRYIVNEETARLYSAEQGSFSGD